MDNFTRFKEISDSVAEELDATNTDDIIRTAKQNTDVRYKQVPEINDALRTRLNSVWHNYISELYNPFKTNSTGEHTRNAIDKFDDREKKRQWFRDANAAAKHYGVNKDTNELNLDFPEVKEDLVFGEPVHRSADREVGIMSGYYDASDSDIDIYSDFSNKNINNEDAFYDSDSDRYGTYDEWINELKIKEFKYGTPEYDEALKKMSDENDAYYNWLVEIADKNPDKADLIEAKVVDERRPRTTIIPKNPEVFGLDGTDIADWLWLEYVNDRFIDKRREEFENNYSPW